MSDAHKQWSKVKLVRKVLEKPTKSQSKSHRSKSEAKQVSFYCSSEDSNDIYFYTCIRKWYWRTEKKLYDIIASLHKSFLCEIIFHKRYIKDPPYDLSYIDVGEGGGCWVGPLNRLTHRRTTAHGLRGRNTTQIPDTSVDLHFVKRIKSCPKNHSSKTASSDHLLILRKVISWN